MGTSISGASSCPEEWRRYAFILPPRYCSIDSRLWMFRSRFQLIGPLFHMVEEREPELNLKTAMIFQ